jgi:RNA polymerase sigma-70 factor (ECF subfamily)
VQQGDRNAFQQLYHRYLGQLYAYAYNKVRSREVAEELVHDVLVKLWTKRREVTVQTTLAPYLFTLLRNAVLYYFRSLSSAEKYVQDITAALTVEDPDAVQAASVNEVQQVMDQALLKLPVKCREIFYLSRYEHRSVEEIANQLKLSSQTVKNQLSKALQIMRIRLKDYATFLLVMVSTNF